MIGFVFYFSLVILGYTYVGYPLLLMNTAFLRSKNIDRQSIQPRVALIVPVYNEEKQIKAKIENCLALDYPVEKLQIIVVSDCSEDKTDDIVRSFDAGHLKLLRLPERRGKVAAQNAALQQVDAEVVVFSDTAITTGPDSLKLIVQNFADTNVGAVSCRDNIVATDAKSNGESSYIKYDMLVRRLNSRVGTLIGVTGGYFAIRKELTNGGWDPAFPPDFYAALQCIRMGYRVVEDPKVCAFYKTAARNSDEYHRKVRTYNRGMCALFANIHLLNPFRYGYAAIALITQKLLRWTTPLFLTTLFVSGYVLLPTDLLAALSFWSLSVVALLAFITLLTGKGDSSFRILNYPFYFVLTNLALLKAWRDFFAGKKYVMWASTKR